MIERDPMRLCENGEQAVITVGTFDGVHRGHQDVLAQLVERAAACGDPALVVTFDPHPLDVVNPAAAPPLLTTREEKLERLAAAGVDQVAVLPFTPALADMDAGAFVDDILRGRFGVRELMVGYDHGFGRGRLGDLEVLRSLGTSRGFRVSVLPPVHAGDGQAVSSTAIRRAVAGGDLERAAAGLGRPYSVTGVVVHGDRRGRTIGYPTLNLGPLHPRKLLPPDGVYAVRVTLPDGDFDGMLNLGPRPTIGDTARRIETHLFDASGDWYGATVRLAFLGRLRGVQPFASLEALRAQLAQDERAARQLLARLSVG